MSEAALPVNQSGPGLTLVYGWSSEEHRAQGASPSIQGIDFNSPAGKVLSIDFCPWCGGKIASSPTRVRAGSSRAEPAPAEGSRPPEPKASRPEPEAAPAAPKSKSTDKPKPPAEEAPAPARTSSLKTLRERLGLSQAELGEKLGLARSSIANYENGRAPLSQRLRKWMAKHEKKLEDRS